MSSVCVSMCVDVTKMAGTNRDRYTQRLVILNADLEANCE